jgi:uncharacterized membrane protein
MNSISRTFLTGLAAIVPIAVTAYILYWLAASAEHILRRALELAFGSRTLVYWPGMGVAAAVVVIFLTGLLMRAWLVRAAFGWAELVLGRIPLVKTLYGSVRDLMGFFSSPDRQLRSQAVMVTLGESGLRLLGLVTREDFAGLPEGIGSEDEVAVYLPMSYQIGGYTIIVPRSALESVEMSMEEAMRFAVTAGMTAPPGRKGS